MSEKVFKPVADAFALIHAGGEPYQWTTNAVEAVAWLNENPKYSVKEYVSLDRYQAVVPDEIADLQQKLDAVLAENARMKKAIKRIFPEGTADEKGGIGFSDASKECHASAIETPATDALLNSVRAEGADKVAEYHFVRIDALKEVSRQGHLFHKAAYSDAVNVAKLYRAETGSTSSQYESLAGGK